MTTHDPAPTPDAILQTGLAFWPAKTLLSAIELGVFTELASGAETLEGLRTRLGLHPRSARDFFDTLVALGFLTRQDGRYANTAATDLFLDRRKPSYIGGILEMANARLYRFWGDLTEGLKTGLPQNEIKHGVTGPVRGPLCRAGAPEAVPRSDDRAEPRRQHGDRTQLPVGAYRTYVDVGTAQGDLAAQIALANPHLIGQGFDLEAVGPIFTEYVAGLGLAGAADVRAGQLLHRSAAARPTSC